MYLILLRPVLNPMYKQKNRSKNTYEIYITNWFYSYKVGIVFAMYQRMRTKEKYWAGPHHIITINSSVMQEILLIGEKKMISNMNKRNHA